MSTRLRPSFLAAALLGAALLPLSSCGGSEEPGTSGGQTSLETGGNAPAPPALPAWQQPLRTGDIRDVLLITLDGVRADHLVSYGSPSASSPRIDHLAATGVRFDLAISPTPQTLPSHASVMTGVYPFRHGLRTDEGHRLADDVPVLAESLQAAGYRTGAVISSALHAEDTGLARGFDDFDDNLVAGSHVPDRSERRTPATDVTVRAAAWLQQPREEQQPRFLWVHYSDCTMPYTPPPGFAKRVAGNPYDAEIAYVDEQIGSLLDFLRARDELADTLVIVVGSHGESLGEHGADGSGIFVYDSMTRVPMIFSHPRLAQGTIVPMVSSTTDVMPTVLELLGQSMPEVLDGTPLGSVLTGDSMLPDRLVYNESRMPYERLGWADIRALRSSEIRYIRTKVPEIYGVSQDPGELVDFSADAPDQLAQMEEKLAELLADGERDERRPGTPAPILIADEQRPDVKEVIYDYTERERAITAGRALRDGAEAELRALLEGSPDDPELNLALGAVKMSEGRYDLALEPVRIGAEARGASMMDVLALAIVTHELDMPEAVDHLARAQELAPDDPAPALLEGDWARTEGRFADAVVAYEKALRIEPGNLLAQLGLGKTYRASGQLDEARAVLERGLTTNPRVFGLQFELGLVCQATGQFALAAAHFERAAMESPGRARAWRFAGSAMLRVNRQEDALRCFRRAAALGDRAIETQANLANLLFQKRAYSEALPHFEIALEVEPNNAQAWLFQAVALDQLGQRDEAVQSVARARQIDAAQVAGFAGARDDITDFLQRNP